MASLQAISTSVLFPLCFHIAGTMSLADGLEYTICQLDDLVDIRPLSRIEDEHRVDQQSSQSSKPDQSASVCASELTRHLLESFGPLAVIGMLVPPASNRHRD
jgi:hypothetical protein